MSLLRNGVDNSINFQRASLSLEGCVKIWTSRVDNVGSETAKLASNLASGAIEEEDGEGSDNDGEEGGAAPKKKRSHRTAATLVKDPAQLKHKNLELESNVDPLFKKTCADFDEGGAQGLLMNHLSLGVGRDGGLTVVFDAGDSAVQPGDDEVVEEPYEEIDLSELRGNAFNIFTSIITYRSKQLLSSRILLSWRGALSLSRLMTSHLPTTPSTKAHHSSLMTLPLRILMMMTTTTTAIPETLAAWEKANSKWMLMFRQ